jgi:hypothetical protein
MTSFNLWFSEKSYRAFQFSLDKATLKVYGTSAVPVPAAVWLLGSGLLGLTGTRRFFK